ncbi:hypothetical protein EYF80_004328 [Liparis tanakae]|uniref:Uncharacterized protein n=1 Tax=Liparis tanakae TaxID=230148 RepID=A0A4Z2J557_9TELE|nr:hypothetical protein EYF80_004328 [Liparis tanakae]
MSLWSSDDLTLSTLMIWNLCVMSAGLEGSLERPETKRRNSTLSSLVNSSKLCQNQPMSWWLSVMSRISTETSGRPQTSCSSCWAVSRERRGTGMMLDMPSLTAATWTQHSIRFDASEDEITGTPTTAQHAVKNALQGAVGEQVHLLQVRLSQWHRAQLLPHPGSQMQVQRFLGADSHSHEDTQEAELDQVILRERRRVQQEPVGVHGQRQS